MRSINISYSSNKKTKLIPFFDEACLLSLMENKRFYWLKDMTNIPKVLEGQKHNILVYNNNAQLKTLFKCKKSFLTWKDTVEGWNILYK